MASAERHCEISAEFMEHADDQMRQGDLLQASEKAWGAVAHCVNSIARANGWRTGSNELLVANARRLYERDRDQIDHRRRLWQGARSLHANFYQELLDEGEVRQGINDAKELIEAFMELADRPDVSEPESRP